MSNNQTDLTKLGFARAFIVPALWVFLVPVLGFLFFSHAESSFDSDFQQGLLRQVGADRELTPEQREEALRRIETFRVSEMLQQDPAFAQQMDGDVVFYYATFRWMKRIALACIAMGLGAFLFVAVSIPLSLRSQSTQYTALSISWHLLRIIGALQVVGQGALLVALSFWVTALWMNIYIMKLIIIVAVMAIVAVGVILKAIFTRPNTDFHIQGVAIEREQAGELWADLESICEEVGTEPPAQIIAGIDDSFFVTEQPVFVGDETYHGRTLFVSLSLLRQLNGSQADAVMAHEMAHFSGNDTLYSRKIGPLLAKYDTYLGALHEGGVTIPVYHFMVCFRALFQLSLGKLSREREFRADEIAARVTSPEDFSSALLRIIAFSKYRGEIEKELFEQEDTSQITDISDKIRNGFHEFAVQFAGSEKDIGHLEVSHPFDAHPATTDRLDALGITLTPGNTEEMLTEDADGLWFENVGNAADVEKKQWDDYEQQFREYHEQTLCYRYLPNTSREQEIVLKYFPEVSFASKDGDYVIDMFGLRGGKLKEPVLWSNVDNCELNQALLTIRMKPKGHHSIKVSRMGKEQQNFLAALQNYYGRYLAAQEAQKTAAAAEEDPLGTSVFEA